MKLISPIAVFLTIFFASAGFPAEDLSIAYPKFKFSIGSFYKDSFDEPVSVFVDKENEEIYIIDSGKNEILTFDAGGFPLFRFGGFSGGLSVPIDIVVKRSRIYLTQRDKPYIQVLDLRGEHLERLSPEGKSFMPTNMDMDDEGNIYVVDSSSNRAFVLNDEDKFVSTVGEKLTALVGVAVGSDRVYLITILPYAPAIHVYTKEGVHLTSFEGIGEEIGGTLALPVAAKVDKTGNFWLVDAMKGVTVFGRDYVRFTGFGRDPGGVLYFPVDIDFGGDGVIYIIDKGQKKLNVYK